MRSIKRYLTAGAIFAVVACVVVNSAQPVMPKGPSPWDKLINQSKQQLQSGDYSAARSSLDEALVMSRKFQTTDPRLGTMYHCLGNLYFKEQDYSKAGEYFLRAIPIEQKVVGPDSLEVADAMFGLSNCYQRSGNAMLAEVYIKRVVEIWSKAYGPESEKLLSVLPSLATYASLNSNYKLSEETHRRILRIKEKSYGASDPRVGSSLNTLSSMAASEGKYKEAKELAERATNVLSKSARDTVAYDSAVTNLEFSRQQLGESQPAAATKSQPLITEKPAGTSPATIASRSGSKEMSTTAASEPAASVKETAKPEKQSPGVTTERFVRAPNTTPVTTTPDEFRPWELKNQTHETMNGNQNDRSTSWGKIRYLAGGKLISQEEYKAMLLANEAYELIREEKYRMAADILRKAVAMCPTLASVRTNLGLALSRLGENDQAIEELKQSLSLDDSRTAAWLNLASCFQINGQLKESVATYGEFLRRFPSDSVAGKARDLVGHLQKEVDKQTAVERALASRGGSANDYFAYATHEKATKWAKQSGTLKVFINSGSGVPGYKQEYGGFCKDAFKQWSSASDGKVAFEFVSKPEAASIDFVWTNDPSKVSSLSEGGEARVTYTDQGIDHATITVLTIDPSPDSPLSANQVRSICLHEIGHAIGLMGHSPKPQDVMYCSIPPADAKVGLSSRDVATLKRLYAEGVACRSQRSRIVASVEAGGTPALPGRSMASASQLVAQLMLAEKENLPTPVLGKTKRKSSAAAEYTPFASWIDPDVPMKGALLCVHGLGLHKGTYAQFGERMAKQGWAVYAVDVRGFGSFQEMPGARKVDLAGCLDDIKKSLEFIRATHPTVPVFLVGESMGGAIALRVTSRNPELVDGLISSVPAGDRFHQANDTVKIGLKLLTGPNKEMNVAPIVVDRSTANEELRQQWLKDPLARFQLSPNELIQFQHFMDENHNSAKRITKTPVLMLQGTKDTLVKHEGNETIINEIPCKDSMLVFVDSKEHLILEEGQFDNQVIDTICAWLDDHSRKKLGSNNR